LDLLQMLGQVYRFKQVNVPRNCHGDTLFESGGTLTGEATTGTRLCEGRSCRNLAPRSEGYSSASDGAGRSASASSWTGSATSALASGASSATTAMSACSTTGAS